MIDWAKIEEDFAPKFKSYVDNGDYTVKCTDVEFKEVGQNGSIIAKFGFEETDDGKFPTADHWCTFKEGKDGWRQYHMKSLMVVLGASEDNAKKAVEVCESKSGKDNIVKAYEAAFKKLLAKKPEVEIEVYPRGKYSSAEFKSPLVAMPHDDEPKKEAKAEDVLAGAEEVTGEDLGDLPF